MPFILTFIFEVTFTNKIMSHFPKPDFNSIERESKNFDLHKFYLADRNLQPDFELSKID